MKPCLALAAVMFLPLPAFSSPQNSASSVTALPASQLQLSQATEAPGTSLSRGTYSIRIADRLQDRLIVQIQKTGSSSPVTLLAYPNPGLRGGTSTGPINFLSGLKGKPTLRGYAFPGGPVVEFVFPKADAVSLAKDNAVRVMAVDTASEGRVSLPNLSQTDMNEVTLWMLTPTAIDPATSKPGIQAARYQVPAAPVTNSAAGTDQADAGSQPTSAAPEPSVTAAASKRSAGTPTLVASNHSPRLRPNVKQLPHTASNLPLLSLTGVTSIFAAAILTMRRRLRA